MAYRVSLRPAAALELARQHGVTQVALHGAILALGDEPRPRGAIKLAGTHNTWRVRVTIDGVPWRIVYRLEDRDRWVRVMRVARRDEGTYRGLR